VNRTEKIFLENVRRQNLAGKGDAVLIAVSGGPDSMALLHLFMSARPVLGCVIAAAHANFGLRGEESDADESFVKEACRTLGIECHVRRFETLGVAGAWKKSIEETARIQRYGFFEEVCREFGYTRIATGHHVGDNAETMLFNLFRGTSTAGARGIRAANGRLIRPLLPFGRDEILAYLEGKSVPWRTDASNLDTVHDRNFIRHRVIPLIEERFSGKFMPALQRMSEHAGELEDFVERHVAALVDTCPGLDLKGGKLHVVTLQKLTPFERKELLKRALQAQGASVDGRVLQRLADLLVRQAGRSVPIGRGMHVVRKDGFLLFRQEP
jgi:tRNA(Ile)-lysidine synthase